VATSPVPSGGKDRAGVPGRSPPSSAGPADFHSFLWDDGTLTDLGARTNPWDLNDNAQIVGGGPPAFLWQDGVIIDLATLGGSTMALDINEHGQAVGVSTTSSGVEHAVLWTR